MFDKYAQPMFECKIAVSHAYIEVPSNIVSSVSMCMCLVCSTHKYARHQNFENEFLEPKHYVCPANWIMVAKTIFSNGGGAEVNLPVRIESYAIYLIGAIHCICNEDHLSLPVSYTPKGKLLAQVAIKRSRLVSATQIV